MRYRRPEYAGCHGFDAEGWSLEATQSRWEQDDLNDECADCGLDRGNAQRDGNDLVRNAAGEWKCPDCEWLGDE